MIDGENCHIIVVDDDSAIRELVSDTLRDRGYRVTTAADVRELEKVWRNEDAHLIILDIMMPGEDGRDACRRIAAENGPPIVFLSALGEERDRIHGLNLGASHYLSKPCSSEEIVATVKAALRHRHQHEQGTDAVRMFAGWRIDPSTRELLDPDGVLVALTDGEFGALRSFVEHPRRVLTREQLLEWTSGPESEAFDRAVDVRVSRLRRKLRAPGDEMIRTVRNEGYLFVPKVTRP